MNDTEIIIAEGNYGFEEIINITSPLLQIGDKLTFIIKASEEATTRIYTKEYTIDELTDNTYTLILNFTRAESEKLPAGFYVWGIEQSRENALQDLPIEPNYYGDFIVKKGI